MKSEEFLAVQAATAMRKKREGWTWRMLLCAAFFTLHASLFTSCSEDTGETIEFDNWQQRNDAFFATLEDSLAQNPTEWTKLKSYTKDPSFTTGTATECIYVKKMPAVDITVDGDKTSSPMSSDSVRISYEGKLIPSANYPTGYIFDSRSYNKFDVKINATSKFIASSLVNGLTTAMLHMHRGDYWRVYIPYELGYGTTTYSSIPAYSTLIFDVVLIDFSRAGVSMPVWDARQQTFIESD